MSELRYIGLKEEVEYNENLNDVDIYIDSPSVSINPNGGNEIRVPSAFGKTDRKKRAGRYSVGGSFDLPLDLNSIGYLFKYLLDEPHFEENLEGGNNKHIYGGTNKKTLKSFRAAVGKDVEEFIYRGLVLSEFSLSASNELVNISANVVGARDETGTLKTEGEVQDKLVEEDPLVFSDVRVFINNDELETREFSLSINNNANVDNAHKLGTRFPKRIKGGNRETSLSLTVFNDDIELLKKFWGNTTGPDESNGSETFSVRLEFVYNGEQMVIDLPKAYIDTHTNDYSGRDEMSPSVSISTLGSKQLIGGKEVDTEIIVTLENGKAIY